MTKVPKSRRRFKTYLNIFLPSFVVLLVVFLAAVGYVSYEIIFPEVSVEGNPSYYLLIDYKEVLVPNIRGAAWLLPGKTGAPAVFLCHDYGLNRMSTLNLGAALHEVGYSVYVLSFAGGGGDDRGPSALGLIEGSDLSTAVAYSIGQGKVDPKRVGVWGVGLGAHAALRAALAEPRIRALVLDSPYSSVYDFVGYQVEKRIGFRSKILGASVGLVSAAYFGKMPPELYETISPKTLHNVSVLYVVGADSPTFVDWTKRLHAATPEPKELRILPKSRRVLMNTPEWRGYDLRVVDYFERVLPVRVTPEAKPARKRLARSG